MENVNWRAGTPLKHFFQMFLDALDGVSHKEVEDLTDMERIALAYAAGVGINTEVTEDHRLVFKTRRPVGIKKIDGRFQVAERFGDQVVQR